MKNELIELINIVREKGLAAYIIPTSDFHGSEYIGAHFQAREMLSGFTGSAGTLVIVGEEVYLFTDGRYHLQAERELNGSGIVLMKSGLEGVPSVTDFIIEKLSKKDDLVDHEGLSELENAPKSVGCDGRVVSASFIDSLIKKAKDKGLNLSISAGEDLVGKVWIDRPVLKSKDLWPLSYRQAGKTVEEKVEALCEELGKEECQYMVVSALDEIAWLLNIRGDDVMCNPVLTAFLVIESSSRKKRIFLDMSNEANATYFAEQGISVSGYNEIYGYLKERMAGKKVLIDDRTANYLIKESLSEAELVIKTSPLYLAKAVKNQAEISGEIHAHLRDGVAVCKFLAWLDSVEDKTTLTEMSVAEKLLEFRKAQEGFIAESFEPIAAYKENAAVIHYSATQETNKTLGNSGLLLLDTGAHYDIGTTDITRTVPLGPVTDEEKKAYTLVLTGHMRLLNARFLAGTTGSGLDYIAREPLWKYGMDYRHGTGHGVGHILNVHEGPNNISFRRDVKKELGEIKPGMITSCEPGFYKDGEYGIRHESLMLARLGEKNEYGQFLYHEPLTMVPFDLRAVDWNYLNNEDKENLMAYQRMVKERIAPFLSEDELQWMERVTTT